MPVCRYQSTGAGSVCYCENGDLPGDLFAGEFQVLKENCELASYRQYEGCAAFLVEPLDMGYKSA